MKERSNWDIILKNETQEYAKCNFTVKKFMVAAVEFEER